MIISEDGEDEELRVLKEGDYFGEQSLLKEAFRSASVIALPPGVECLTLEREYFFHLRDDLTELQEKTYQGDNIAGVENEHDVSKSKKTGIRFKEYPYEHLTFKFNFYLTSELHFQELLN